MHAGPSLNKFVISTGAKRSGEICGFLSGSHAACKAQFLFHPLRPD
jgi:hypothetical protein